MALLEINWNPSRRELRHFALLCVGVFGAIAAYCFWFTASSVWAAVFGALAVLGLIGCVRPGFLRPMYVVWMALALPIGWTISHLLLLVVYYLVLTPIGFVMRLFGYDPLARHFDRSAKSYWTPHDPGADPARYFKQY